MIVTSGPISKSYMKRKVRGNRAAVRKVANTEQMGRESRSRRPVAQ